MIFADIARPNIAWPSIVQHLTSIHPAVIHHNSTASISSRHVITLRSYLFCSRLPLSCLRPWTTYPSVSNFLPFSIRITIRYLCTLTPTPHSHLSSPRRLRWPMNSLRPFFRLLFASTRLPLFVLFSPWVWDTGYCHITSKHYKHKTVHTSHNDGVVVLMDVHEIQKNLFGLTQTTAAEQINSEQGITHTKYGHSHDMNLRAG